MHTGDLARQDEDGYYYIFDRKKDMIIRLVNELAKSHTGKILKRKLQEMVSDTSTDSL